MSALSGWPESSPSGRLLTMIVTPRSRIPVTSSGEICPLTSVLSSSWRNIGGFLLRLLVGRDRGEHRFTIAQQLRFAHALDSGQFGQAVRPRLGDSAKRRIVEHDVRRDSGGGGDVAA